MVCFGKKTQKSKIDFANKNSNKLRSKHKKQQEFVSFYAVKANRRFVTHFEPEIATAVANN